MLRNIFPARGGMPGIEMKLGSGACRLMMYALITLWATVSLIGCAGRHFRDVEGPLPPAVQFGLDSLPVHEYWTGIVFNGNKVGFTHFMIAQSKTGKDLYEIRSRAVVHFRFLMMEKGVSLSSYDLVDKDLHLLSFDYEYDMDESRLRLTGFREGGVLKVLKSSAGLAAEEAIPVAGELFPGSALYLYPLLRGIEVGKGYTYSIFDGESQGISGVSQQVLAYQRSDLFTGEGFKMETRYLGQKVTTWIDRKGLPLLEIALGGVLISGLESEQEAKHYLVESSLNKSDPLLDFSLIRISEPIRDPGRTRFLKVSIENVPPEIAIPTDSRQVCDREGGRVVCRVSVDAGGAGAGPGEKEPDGQQYLKSSYSIPGSSREIRSLAREITGGSTGREQQIRLIMGWMKGNIAQEPVDAFNALDVLAQRKGECQGHAYLYAALARSIGIPTRIANGIVYAEQFSGFLYHAWAESLVNGKWIAVDPILGQMPADATHIKLVEGETLASLMPMTGVMGRIRMEVIEVK